MGPLKRPYITLRTRIKVLERQAYIERVFENEDERESAREWYRLCCHALPMTAKVHWLLELLFKGEETELDHDPALELRRFNQRTGKYSPDANDPRFLVYRLKPKHLQKTTGRAPGAERTVTSKGSDAWLAKKFRKLEQPQKPKRKIPSRGFPKQRSSFATNAGKDS